MADTDEGCMSHSSFSRVARLPVLVAALCLAPLSLAQISSVHTVFVIVMSNQPWSAIKGSSHAPYINGTLLPMGSSAGAYYAPAGSRVFESNSLWLEAGSNFGVVLDAGVQQAHQATTSHLTTLLTAAGISWKAYFEDISGANCPLSAQANYDPKFNPFVFFDDVTSSLSPTSMTCIAHIRSYAELAADLMNNTVTRYVFIKPNECHSMFKSCPTLSDAVGQGDQWLAQEVPKILASSAYQNGAALFILWDQTADESPLGMLILSPLAKQGYTNTVRYTHSSTLRTIEEIFAVSPLLGDAVNQSPLDDFFGASTANHGSIKLSWSASQGALTYNVKRSTTSAGPFLTIASGIPTTTYTDTTSTGGQTYFYVVSAVNGSGESPPSTQTSATVPSAPLAPTNLTVVSTP
jgi:phosphatidylinositol-3-phosphatase